MAQTEILLLGPIEGLGAEGDQVKVKAGYARNYLLPQKKALPVTKANVKQIEALQKRREEREARERQDADSIATKLVNLSLAFSVKTGEGGKMFGSITSNDLQNRLQEEGIELDRKHIQLGQPIKTLGKHSATIKLHPEVSVELPFEVVSENPIEETAEEAEAGEKQES